jgi:Tfp pilus assembly protein PilO
MSLAKRIYVERRKVALPLLGFLAANIAVFTLAVLPLRRAVASAEEGAIDATMKLNLAKVSERNAIESGAKTKQADEELQKFYAEILPRDFATARSLVLYWSQRTAGASSLTLRSGEFEQKTVDDSRLVRVSGRITLIGQYANIRRFLYALETAEEFIIVENVALEQAMLQGATGANTTLTLALDLATYYLGGTR